MQNNYDAIMPIAKRPDLVFAEGKGSWIWDEQGKHYLDFIQGWAVNTLGHSPDVITETLHQQSTKLLNASPAFYNRPMLDCAELLVKHSVFDQVFFANSGAEANEGAIKLARKWGEVSKSGAWKIITFDNGFHGRTLTTMAASGKAAFSEMFEPKTPGFIKVPFNDIEAVKNVLDEETVAVMLEPIQGEAGVIPADLSFMQELRQLTQEKQLLLIVDEVQTGVARTGDLFAYEGYGIEPDIMTLGKGLGGGVPIAALLAKSCCSVFEAGEQGGTYNGNPLMTAVAHAVIREVLQSSFLEQVNRSSRFLWKALTPISLQFSLGKVRGKGLLLALDTGDVSAVDIAELCLAKGLLINAPRENTLRFVPALNVSQQEMESMLVILSEVLSALIKRDS